MVSVSQGQTRVSKRPFFWQVLFKIAICPSSQVFEPLVSVMSKISNAICKCLTFRYVPFNSDNIRGSGKCFCCYSTIIKTSNGLTSSTSGSGTKATTAVLQDLG